MKRLINRKRKKEKSRIGIVIYNHIINNKRNYIIATILFFIGLIVGVMFVNNIKEEQFLQIDTYIKSLINNVKNTEKIDYILLLKESIISNFILVIIVLIASSTIIGIPIVYITVIIKGFSLGYTISSILAVLGTGNGILFILSTLLLHNIIFIPILLAISVSGMKLYKSITQNRERENIKIEFLRHLVFCTIMLLFLIVASLIEVYVSTNLSKFFVNYINF